MTVLDRPAAANASTGRGHVTQLRVLHSEWIKLRTLRSTLVTLTAAVVAMIGLGVLFCAVSADRWPHMDRGEQLRFSAAGVSVRGFLLAQLAVAVLGVLVVSGEYATGMIRATLAAVPRRLPVLWAKAAVYTAVTFLAMTTASLIAFLAGQAILSSQHIGVSLGSPGAARMVVGAGLYLTVVGLLSVAIGGLVRSTAGGIATVFGLLIVLPLLADSLPSTWSVSEYLPGNAGQALLVAHPEPHILAPWTGFAVFCLYTAVALTAAAAALSRRDA
ncbi:ABC transporter permease [Streptomyces sp. SPB162]|uniref:ABC transporter permease n=1 Tax=Streptomyces sp. SPB162 TaxID=2940560 RepID=UPI0024062E75|nr:ABC transporter permease [Streptomyces sp. SPB162]MDF9816014.1 ABC-2 type transport system permease protein [Streptomyces sp. SPB162]